LSTRFWEEATGENTPLTKKQRKELLTMRTILFAYHTMGCVGLETLLRNGFDVVAVFTHRDDPDENMWFSSVAQCASAHNIPVFAPDEVNHPLWVAKIRDLRPDIIFSFYYRRLLSPSILEIPPQGCMNLHGSLLPGYRGRVPINWAIIHGEKETGVTLHYMTPRPDDGDIVCQERIEISPDDTARSLLEKAAQASAGMLERILPRIREGTAPREPQDHSKASYFGGRRPEDGEINWQRTATEIRNLVRAVTLPYPGAFSHVGDRKCLFWKVTETGPRGQSAVPGTVLTADPLVIATSDGTLRVDFAQPEGGLYMTGAQMSRDLNLMEGMTFGPSVRASLEERRKKEVLILGVDGFIGNALTERLLRSGRYEVHGMDLHSRSIRRFMGRPGFHFSEGDIAIHREWIEYHVKKCDIVLPLVAIATPIEYTRHPLNVFELDFEENLRVVRYCVKYGKRIVFPSTSEVYGMCEDEEFNEDHSPLVLGPIRMQRWIYSCCKQLLDRVIWAYGQEKGLQFTLFRPFNWIGPRLDSLDSARIGSSRAITQLILNLVEGTPIQLVDGGSQKRCFTDISDGVECLYRIIENKGGECDGRIFNIGAPDNEASIRDLARMLVDDFERHPLRSCFPSFAGFRDTESKTFYGAGYQDVQYRRPSIKNAHRILGWSPLVELPRAVERTLDFFLRQASGSMEDNGCDERPSCISDLYGPQDGTAAHAGFAS
jgi:UDP-4-amino-4-deoxy-L-arabinose formyltransferase/UDP-glucuronic acid dehydrogenase (UDP-4-keto-hexauronic acid decarboxylating)